MKVGSNLKKKSAEKKRMSSTQNKKGQISGYVKHIRWKTPEIWGVLQRICLTYPEIRPFLF